jgi:hypothetical protein
MRKRVIKPAASEDTTAEQGWLDVEEIAQVEVTSEDAAYPVESALVPGEGGGWRAAQPGEQTIRLVFDRPQRVSRIWLLFIEADTARTQEFVLRWSPAAGQAVREIVRQQWNFGPPETIREVEDYRVELSGVMVLELAIVPDKSGGEARASLAQCRLAG